MLTALDRPASSVSSHGLLTEIRLVRHVAGERGVMSEHCVFDHGVSGLYRLEEIPEMEMHVVEVGAFEGDRLRHRLLTEFGSVFGTPFLLVGLAHGMWKAACIVT